MVSTNVGLAGKPVYGNNSYRPTSGQVNPAGYIQREQRKPASPKLPGQQQGQPNGNNGPNGGVSTTGNDGQSDTRSGIAANALRSQIGQQGYQAATAAPASGGNSTPPTPVPNAIGSVPMITPTGLIDLPYDPKYGIEALNRKQKLQQSLLEIQTKRQEDYMGYQRSLRDANQDYGEVQRSSLADNANRGTAFSSGYGKTIGDNATKYNDLLGDIQSNNTSSQNTASAGVSGAQKAWSEYVQQQSLSREAALHKKAGTGKAGKASKKKSSSKSKAKAKSKAKPKAKSSKYKIKRGDTLSQIAKKSGTSTAKLAKLNKIKNPNLIYAGRSIRLR